MRVPGERRVEIRTAGRDVDAAAAAGLAPVVDPGGERDELVDRERRLEAHREGLGRRQSAHEPHVETEAPNLDTQDRIATTGPAPNQHDRAIEKESTRCVWGCVL